MIIVGFFGNDDSSQQQASSELCSPTLTPSSGNLPATVTLQSRDDGSIHVVRRGVMLADNCSVYIKVEFVKDHATLTEKIVHGHHPADVEMHQHDLAFVISTKPRKKYYVRYESPENSTWGTTHFANYDNYTVTIELKS